MSKSGRVFINMSGPALACKGAADPGKLALDLTRAPSGRRKRGAV